MAAFNFKVIRNQIMRKLFEDVFNTSSGHDHDGTNSKAVTVGTVGAGLVTNTELATDVKVGSLAALTTTEKGSVVGAINEVDASAAAAAESAAAAQVDATAALATVAGNVTLTGAETLTNKVLTDAVQTWTLGAHDYEGAAADWTLSAAELLKPVHKPTNANAPVNAIVADTIRPYLFINGTGQNLTVKTAAGTGITIANGKAQQVMSDGTNVIAIAAVTA